MDIWTSGIWIPGYPGYLDTWIPGHGIPRCLDTLIRGGEPIYGWPMHGVEPTYMWPGQPTGKPWWGVRRGEAVSHVSLPHPNLASHQSWPAGWPSLYAMLGSPTCIGFPQYIRHPCIWYQVQNSSKRWHKGTVVGRPLDGVGIPVTAPYEQNLASSVHVPS